MIYLRVVSRDKTKVDIKMRKFWVCGEIEIMIIISITLHRMDSIDAAYRERKYAKNYTK